jgi:hypothetical protein
MPSLADHQAKCMHNRKFRKSEVFANNGEFADWLVVVMFYESMHLVEQELSKHNLHFNSHGKRNMAVSSIASLKNISVDYLTLLNQSRRARYFFYKFTPKDVEGLKEAFARIENTLSPPAA